MQANIATATHNADMRMIRGIFGFLVGYAAVAVITEFGFRLFPDRPLHSGRPLIMAGAALVAIVAGVAGGMLATWIARSRVAGFIVLIPLTAETIWLLFIRDGEPQTWLDAAAALTLLAAVATGSCLVPRTVSPPRARAGVRIPPFHHS